MQVDTDQLRKAAVRLRQDVAKQLERAQRTPREVRLEATFDSYTTAKPYDEAALAWSRELDLLIRATAQLAEALEQAAADYDKADGRAGQRMVATQ